MLPLCLGYKHIKWIAWLGFPLVHQSARLGFDSAGHNARLNRGEKLKIPGGENIFVIVTQKKKLPFSFPHLTAGDDHKASLAVAVVPWARLRVGGVGLGAPCRVPPL